MKNIIINVKGMVCNGCENRVKNALKNIEGVKDVTADYNTGKVIITSNDNILEKDLKDKILDLGFEIMED